MSNDKNIRNRLPFLLSSLAFMFIMIPNFLLLLAIKRPICDVKSQTKGGEFRCLLIV